MLKNILILVFIPLQIFASSLTVNVIKPIKKMMSITVDANGVVQSQNKIVITTQSNGILAFEVAQDTFVHKGDMIASVSNKIREKKLYLLKNKLALQKNEINTEQIKLDRAEDKYKLGVGSKNSYLSETISLEQLKDIYVTTKYEYEILLLEQENAIIYAPYTGVLTNLQANNSYINYGSKIATLLDENNLVKLFVDAFYAKQIKKGMLVTLKNSYKDCDARVLNILPKSSNNLIEVIVQPQEKLPLNLSINAQIVLKKLHGILIPKEAILLVDNHPVVYVIDKKNIAHLFFIEIQKDMINNALIKETLPENANIALKNAYMLHDNLEVIIK